MSDPDSVAPRERLRLFVAFPLPRDAAERLAAWGRELAGAPDARLVPAENLHVTLAFLGSTPRAEIGRIVGALRAAAGVASRPILSPARYRETRSVGMVVLDDADARATILADEVGAGLERLGVYRRERRPWLPHVTVLRFRQRPRLDPPLPALGRVSPSEVALYHSVLRPNGAQHEIVESVALRA
ncbi:MAG TPA: RNA 2',3'-cyclic phosphodiesterase [Gaiellaceae bacterium]|jgi:2'-5' RNA ligase|nr:RNA 2',3'-cyclic phosphodiesterase [Gaiellaceae bacterium]